jgi:thiamine biosynthesis lipoprotein
MSQKRMFSSCFLLIVLLAFISCQGKTFWRSSTLFCFDTLVEVQLLDTHEASEDSIRIISSVLEETEVLFKPRAEVFSSPVVLDLYARSEEIYQHTSGCFDISVEPLSRLWGFRNKNYRVPTEKEILNVMTLVGMDRITQTKDRLILQPGMELDWGGVAKGLGVDRAVARLIEKGVERGYINAGGDLFCWGKNPDDSPWKIGIKHPRKQGFIGVLSLTDMAAATTGDYIRYFEQNGRRFHHVFDPRTGYPAKGKQSVTVIGPETLVCDALSTALFVCDNPEDALRHYPSYGAILVLDTGEIQALGRTFPFDAK